MRRVVATPRQGRRQGRSSSSNSDRLLRDGLVHFHSGGRVTLAATYSFREKILGIPTLARTFLDSPPRETSRLSCRISASGSWLTLVVTRALRVPEVLKE